MLKKPFFARFLENESTELPVAAEDKAGANKSKKYPSDGDEFVTLKYPSDDDEGGVNF